MPSNRRRRTFLTSLGTGLSALLAGCGGNGNAGTSASQSTTGNTQDTPSSTATESETETQTQEGPSEASLAIGESVEGDNISMVVRSVETTESISQFQQADSGNVFYVLRMAVKNTSSEFLNFSGFWQARVTDAEDYTYNASFAATDHPLGTDVLAPGEVSRGDMVFELPEDASGLTLEFDFTAFSLFAFDRVLVNLEEQADSTANLEQTLQVSVNDVGSSVSHGDVTIALNEVRTESSLGQYTSPDDGNEYYVTNITVTNDSDEPLSVSTLLQMAVKDGTGLTYGSDLMATSSLDRAYSEGSEIAPGDSRRGELAYQLPTDIGTAYWTFNFYTFDAEQKAFWEIA